MTKVEGALFAWHRLYLKLQDARLRLKQSRDAAEDIPSQLHLEAEVSRLQQESDSVLETVNAALAMAKRPDDGGGRPLNS